MEMRKGNKVNRNMYSKMDYIDIAEKGLYSKEYGDKISITEKRFTQLRFFMFFEIFFRLNVLVCVKNFCINVNSFRQML